ncbi:PRKR-interacting protein 1 homolog [Aedes albopictus]|uniref:Prkr-interacting protein 1 n=1 Tax=Aedes albopictus TaxID=7160 RepID=A0ABM1XYH2_AEDAL
MDIRNEVKITDKDFEKKKFVVRNAADVQRAKLEKLMKNPDKPVIIPESPRERDFSNAIPSFVRNVMGSSAGAGSGEFHVYRHLRRKEYARQKHIQEKSRSEQLDDEFQQKLEQNKQDAEDRTAKKRAKRQKKKAKQKANRGKKPRKEEESEKSESDEEDDEVVEEKEEDDRKTQGKEEVNEECVEQKSNEAVETVDDNPIEAKNDQTTEGKDKELPYSTQDDDEKKDIKEPQRAEDSTVSDKGNASNSEDSK